MLARQHRINFISLDIMHS